MSVLAEPHLAYVERVERRLADAVGEDGRVSEAGGQTLRSGGKRLRPLLVYLSAPTAGRDTDAVVSAGCAVELVHMATLVHDDQLDAAPLRRGRPTVWSTHGPVIATATGDHLFARAFAELVRSGEMRAVGLLADACLALARGEILQRAQAGQVDTTVELYLERCRLKTGRLFAAATMLGGLLGGLDDRGLAALSRFGESLGVAFQIADDLLDGTVSLPLLLAARHDREVRRVLLRGAGPEDVLPTLARVAASGALEQAGEEARRLAADAEQSLAGLDDRVEADLLRAAVRTAVERER